MPTDSFARRVLRYLARTEPPFGPAGLMPERSGFLAALRAALAFQLFQSVEPEDGSTGSGLRKTPRRGADLLRTDLRGADLRGSDLRGAVLAGASLRSANLRGADLRGVSLAGADLRTANLSDANLAGADLARADLRDANLSHADLRGAVLCDATLVGVNLSRADLRDADLRGADLEFSNLIEVRWSLATGWPADRYPVIRGRSIEVEPEVFEIQADDARDREGAPTPVPA
ncbi:pentapeptide repeat-containing protein [Kitasatospora xanthocidica]|uniref:Pentapeptide repeat-containing protein n=1 Tax=Kitasatospora xanthocidica TaxID=83382 RepID=A0A372ZMI8_9ACTN|nr:pentapeptide repeat-containing protein [Kitasatospora xanthocidica]RGD56682.1 pentapeptide repeat-containing protein [Kitasatospora xanthocidica]